MGLFGNMFGRNDSDGSINVIRCDEAEFLIWKYPGGDVKSGSTVTVKDGETAVLIGSTQNVVEGPNNATASENLSAVYYINQAGCNVVRFAVPYFGVTDPRFPDLNVPVAVRGSINFGIEDARSFSRMHRLNGFDMAAFEKKIKDAVVKYVKAVVTNIPCDHGIPLVQMEKKILVISDILLAYLKTRLDSDFAINVRGVDLNAIEYDPDDSNYRQLRAMTQDQTAEMVKTKHQIEMETMRTQSQINLDTMKVQSELNIDAMKTIQSQDILNRGANLEMDRQMRAQDLEDREERMRIQRDLGEKAYNAQIDELQKSGRMAMGGMMGMGQPMNGFTPSGINQIGAPKPVSQIGQPSSLNMGGGINMGGPTPPPAVAPAPQIPPQIPQISIHVAIGGQAQGPFDYHMLKEMVKTGALTPQTLVWKEGLASWTPAIQVPEVASILNTPTTPPVPPTMPPGVPPSL